MKLIFSRKGFDSGSGGTPSPIFPDGRMVSLPIPDKRSPIRYADINWHGFNMGSFVSALTCNRIPASYCAHLDPDLNYDSLHRLPEWKPIFGQTGAARGHARNHGVQVGDLFIFFGLFRNAVYENGILGWNTGTPPRHVLWGWLQIDEIVNVDTCDLTKYPWAKYHPHFYRDAARNNTIYIARKNLELPGMPAGEIAGSGIFPCFKEQLQLTAPATKTPSLWELPQWFYPRNGRSPLSYHGNMNRWQETDRSTRLKIVNRGQEFILECDQYPEAIPWCQSLLKTQ